MPMCFGSRLKLFITVSCVCRPRAALLPLARPGDAAHGPHRPLRENPSEGVDGHYGEDVRASWHEEVVGRGNEILVDCSEAGAQVEKDVVCSISCSGELKQMVETAGKISQGLDRLRELLCDTKRDLIFGKLNVPWDEIQPWRAINRYAVHWSESLWS